MCIIGVFPIGIRPDRHRLEECFAYNPDGWGLAYRGRVEKGVGTFEEFWESYKLAPLCVTVVTHFRTATSGRVNKNMAQPFSLSDGTAVFHNGVIGGMGDDEESDTAAYARTVLDQLPPRWWKDDYWRDKVDWTLASGKMVLLSTDGEVIVIGKERGIEEDGIWWSAPWRGVRMLA